MAAAPINPVNQYTAEAASLLRMIQFVPAHRPDLAQILSPDPVLERLAGNFRIFSIKRRSIERKITSAIWRFMDLCASNRREAPAWSRRANFKHKIFVRFCAPSDISTGLVVLQKRLKNGDYSHCHNASNPTTPTIGWRNPFGRNGFVN